MVRHVFIGVFTFLLMAVAHATPSKEDFYRSFWNPFYHGSLLNYCTLDHKSCGLKVAHQYCQLMGYQKANQEIIAYNVGITRFIGTKAICKGWACNGFKLIRCVGKMKHTPIKTYYYRYFEFAFPRFNSYRVDWCYEKGSGCGHKAAYSFCRRMGYLKTTGFEKDMNAFASKRIGDQKLCFGKTCESFKKIICYR